MFYVFYGSQKFAEFDNDVNACAVALDLHRISNVPHKVSVHAVVNGIVQVEHLVELSKVESNAK